MLNKWLVMSLLHDPVMILRKATIINACNTDQADLAFPSMCSLQPSTFTHSVLARVLHSTNAAVESELAESLLGSTTLLKSRAEV